MEHEIPSGGWRMSFEEYKVNLKLRKRKRNDNF